MLPQPIKQEKHARALKRTRNALERHRPKGAPRARLQLTGGRVDVDPGTVLQRQGKWGLVALAVAGGDEDGDGRNRKQRGGQLRGGGGCALGLDSAWVQPCCAAAGRRALDDWTLD